MVQIGSNSYRPLDMGQIIRDVENVKTARRNRVIKENAMKRQSQVEEARRGALQGKLSSLGDLVTLNPDSAMRFMDAVDRMGADQRVQARQRVEETGRMAAYVMQGETPEEQARRYQLVRGQVDPQIAEKLPEEFDPQLVQYHAVRALEVDKIMDLMTEEQKDKRKHENKLAEIEAQGDKEIRVSKATEKAKGPEGIKSSDSNAIAREIGQLYGGFYNPETEQYAGLDPSTAQRALQISARAEQIFAEAKRRGSPIGHRQAAQRAFREITGKGGRGRQSSGNQDSDPLGIR